MKNVFCTFIYIINRVVSGEIYTAGKNFTLPPAVTALTNFTSVYSQIIFIPKLFLFSNYFHSQIIYKFYA